MQNTKSALTGVAVVWTPGEDQSLPSRSRALCSSAAVVTDRAAHLAAKFTYIMCTPGVVAASAPARAAAAFARYSAAVIMITSHALYRV